MSSFRAKLGWKRPRKSENKNYHSASFLSETLLENSTKIAKKFKKFKNNIMASFQAKVGWKRMRKKENKNYSSVSFLSDGHLKIPKKLKNTNGFI